MPKQMITIIHAHKKDGKAKGRIIAINKNSIGIMYIHGKKYVRNEHLMKIPNPALDKKFEESKKRREKQKQKKIIFVTKKGR